MQKKSKYTFWRIISEWSGLLPQIIRQWNLFLLYGVAVTVLSGAFGRWSFSCQEGSTGPWCYIPTSSFSLMIAFLAVFFILMCILVGLFISDFQQNVNQNSVFKLQDAFSFSKRKIKNAGFVFGVIAGFILPVTIAMAIINKPANPDYRIEFCFFVVMFIMFVIPLLLMRLSAGMAYFMNRGYIPTRKIFKITTGRSFIPLLLFLLLTILMLSVHLRTMGYFSYLTHQYNTFAMVALTDFADNVIKLACLALFLLFFQAQYIVIEQIISEEESEAEAQAIEALPDEIAAPEGVSAKAANKKKNKRKAKAQVNDAAAKRKSTSSKEKSNE